VSDVDGIQRIFRLRADGTGERRVAARALRTLMKVFPDEQWAILRVGNSGRCDIAAYRVGGDTVPVTIAATPAEEYFGTRLTPPDRVRVRRERPP
jgi:hypothetical protein